MVVVVRGCSRDVSIAGWGRPVRFPPPLPNLLLLLLHTNKRFQRTWTMPICVMPKYAWPFTISIIPPGFDMGFTAPGTSCGWVCVFMI